MNKTLIIAIVAVVSLAAGGWGYWLHYSSLEQSLRRACFEVLSDRMGSTDNLEIIRVHQMTLRPITREEFMGPHPVRSEIGDSYDAVMSVYQSLGKMFDIGAAGNVLEINIDYDIKNVAKFPIRVRSSCSYHTFENGDRESISTKAVKLISRHGEL